MAPEAESDGHGDSEVDDWALDDTLSEEDIRAHLEELEPVHAMTAEEFDRRLEEGEEVELDVRLKKVADELTRESEKLGLYE